MCIAQRLFDLIPNKNIPKTQLRRGLNKAGDILSRPMQNRAIMGLTAIVSQPLIDSHNKRVDKDTARASRNRTIGKIIAGTVVGCLVRGGIYNLVTKTTKLASEAKTPINHLLTPTAVEGLSGKKLINAMRNYRSALSTILAMFAMLITNVAIDMPLTTKISNYLNNKDRIKKAASESIQQKNIDPPTPLNNSNSLKTGGVKC